jgi:hypothetical protein
MTLGHICTEQLYRVFDSVPWIEIVGFLAQTTSLLCMLWKTNEVPFRNPQYTLNQETR